MNEVVVSWELKIINSGVLFTLSLWLKDQAVTLTWRYNLNKQSVFAQLWNDDAVCNKRFTGDGIPALSST